MITEDLVRVKTGNAIYGKNTGSPYQVETIADLKAIEIAVAPDDVSVVVLGYYANGDGGGGIFHYDATSVLADNGGTVIAPDSGAGRWVRQVANGVSVRWFGAMGNGVVDDTQAFQNAFTFLAAIGGTLWIPGCSVYYLITDTVLGCSNVLVVGCGSKGPVFNGDPNPIDDISILLFDGQSNFKVRDVYFKGSNKNINVIPLHGSGVAVQDSSDFSVEGCRFEYFTRTATTLRNVTNAKVLHNDISAGNSNLTSSDIETYTETGETNINILIDGNSCNGSNTFGIGITNHGDGQTKVVRVINNDVKNKARHGIYCYAGDTFTPVDIILRGNTVDTTGWIGIYVVGGGLKYVIDGNIIINACTNVTTGLPWAGIGIGGVTGTALVLSNNVIQGTRGYPGIRLDNGNSFSIDTNIIWGDGTAVIGGANGAGAISLNNCSDGNVVDNVVKYTGVEGAGIYVTSSDTTVWNRISVDNNKIYRPSTFGIFASYTALTSLEGNVVDSAVQYGIYLDHSSGASLIGNAVNASSAGSTDIFVSATCTFCSVESNRIAGTKATGSGIVIETLCADSIVQDNDLVGLTALANTAKLTNNGTRTQLKNNKYAAVALNGSFTCAANTSTVVNNANIVAGAKITLTPTNASAGTLQGGTKQLFLATLTSGASFTVTTASGVAAAGTETFDYIIE